MNGPGGPRPDSGTWEYVTSPGQREFADVLEVRVLRWEGRPAFPGRTQRRHRILIKQRQAGRSPR